MKSDVVFGLLDASWPVLLLEELGAIQKANKKAVETFGPAVAKSGATAIDSFWVPENDVLPVDFLVHCKAAPGLSASLRLKCVDKSVAAFQAWVSSFVDHGNKYYVMQLLPDKSAGLDAGIAQKPKLELDSSLQHARWPVLLLEELGAIQKANQRAVETFGPNFGNGATAIDSFWVPENDVLPVDFLVHCKAAPGLSASLHLKCSDKSIATFQAWVSGFADGGNKYYLMQLLPDKTAGLDASLAQTQKPEPKQKLDSTLELASWPVLLLEERGAIRKANPKCVEILGSAVADGAATIDSFWAQENKLPPTDFLVQSKAAPGSPASLRLKCADKSTSAFQACVSSFVDDGKNCYLMQLLPEKIPDKTPGPDASAVQKEKIEKQKPDSLLELANWPVLLLEEGAIRSANKKAIETFGPAVENGALDSLWVSENNPPLKDFLIDCKGTSGLSASLRLKCADKSTATFQAQASSVVDGDHKYYLMQLFLDKTVPLPEKTAGIPDKTSVLPEKSAGPADKAAVLPDKSSAVPDKTAGLDANLAQKQKLDCALQLARTVSLDFNNALTTILGHTSLILSKVEPDNPWRRSLREVEKSAERAAEIANDLGAFSLQEKEAKVQVLRNLNQLLERNVEMFQAASLDKEVSWTLQLERKLYSAKYDEAKMQQALVKIMENAIEALGPRGRIILQTKNIELTEKTQDRNVQLAAGAYVCVEITDDGSGIEPDVLPRIFEPFFTTKRGGKHRGLGLAWVYGIVTNHGGGVAVSSQPNSGTSVRVYLPADKKIVKDNSAPSSGSLNGTETILMVDDEDLLLTMGQTVLGAYGYQVITANSGQKALEIISKGEKHVDLLFTDLVMPGMSGRELVEKVRQISPFIRVLCSSGFVRPATEQEEHTGYLQKPFTSQELLMKVKQVLTPAESAPVDS